MLKIASAIAMLVIVLLSMIGYASGGSIDKWNSNNFSIPDNDGTVSSTITITEAPTLAAITKVWVYYQIRHTCPGDLDVWLTAYYSGGWHDYYLYHYGDLGCSPDDIVESRDNLHTWDCASPNQTWYLSVRDRAPADVGYIDFFEIVVEYNVKPTIDVTAPASNITVTKGDNVSISWNGTDPDNAATVTLFHDSDCNLDNGGWDLIAGGLSEDGTYNWNTSGHSTGTYRIVGAISDGVCSDPGLDCAPGSVTIALPDLKDCGESTRSFSPTNICPTDVLTINCCIRNSDCGGDVRSGFRVKFYASVDQNITSSDYYIGYEDMPADLPNNSSLSCQFSGVPNTQIPEGLYWVGWIIDSQGNVEECNESNNTAYKQGYQLTVRPKPGTPSISGPSEVCGGTPATYTASASGSPTSWSWSSGCGGTFNPQNGNPTNWTPPTSYSGSCQISVTASNSCGPSDSPGTKTVNVMQKPGTPSISGPSEVCGGTPTTYTASASNSPTSWSWSSDCGGTFNPQNGNPTNWTPPTSYIGYCNISVVASNSCGPSNSPGTKTVNVWQRPGTPSISGPSEVCGGTPATYTASASNSPTSWSWTADCGGTFDPPNGSPTSWTPPTSYSGSCQISVTANNSCGSSNYPGTKNVNVNQATSFYFVHITDPHVLYDPILYPHGKERWEDALDKIKSGNPPFDPPPDFVLCSGDLVERGNLGSPVLLSWQALTDPLFKLSGTFYIDPSHTIPIYFCPGNHDAASYPYWYPESFANYYDYIGPDYYYVRHKNCVIFSMNSGKNAYHSVDISPEGDGLKDEYGNEITLLPQDLDALDGVDDDTDNSCFVKIIMMHHPYKNPQLPRSDTLNQAFLNGRDVFINACTNYGVHLFMCGHFHDGEAFGVRNRYAEPWHEGDITKFAITHSMKTAFAWTEVRVNSGKGPLEVDSMRYFASTINFDIDCEALVHVYDQYGNHDGPNGEGAIEILIPGSTYSRWVNDTLTGSPVYTEFSVYKEDTTSYSFVIEGLVDDTMNVTVSTYLTEGIWNEAEYDSIPIYEGSVAALQANGSIVDYTMTILDPDSSEREVIPSSWDGNLPPIEPAIPSGATTVFIGDSSTYITSTTDPENEQVSYMFDWGDETHSDWQGPFSSGDSCSVYHRWIIPGSHNVRVRAIDIWDHMGNWSSSLLVIVVGRGDANGDGVINASDVVYLINYLFISGPAPDPIQAGDANCDGFVNVTDVVYLINYLFIGGPPPCR